MAISEYGIKLALNIISAHFGNLVTKICECLLHKGTLTLSDIIRFTNLPSQQANNCLLVLIQHNCVQPSSQDGEGEMAKGVSYDVVFDNILHRMRFPKFLSVVLDEFDEECVEIVEELLQHGRLSFEQIVSRGMAKRNEGDRDIQEAIRENFEKLVNAHYVERCPDSDTVPMSQDDDNRSLTRTRGPKSTKIVDTEIVEQQIITDGISSERFVVERNTNTDTDISEATTSGKHTNVTVGEKRKIEALKSDDGTKVVLSEKEVLWRANFEEFVSHLRRKACVASVRSRYDAGAGIVLNAMLQATRKAERKMKTERSVPLSKDDILNMVMEIEECCSMTLEDIVAVLSQLHCPCVTVEGKESYSIDLKDIIETAQNDEVESLVLKRFGKDAYKMFRLLSLSARAMETNKISDDAFVEKKEALKLLYHLWKDNYLHMEKVTAHGSAQRQFLLWKINNCSVRERAFDEMCHAALNLRLRLAYEVEQEREILQLPQDEVGGAQEKKFKRIEKVKEVLEASLMKLDDDIMLFHDL
ncbi:hypothetical protein ACHQM5_003694 [Ranunculus cassubicifolius]